LRFLKKSAARIGFLIGRSQQKLDGHGTPEPCVLSPVDFPHATAVNLA
jgi:hypothetical protein